MAKQADSGANWTDIPGAITTTYTTPQAHEGTTLYRLVAVHNLEIFNLPNFDFHMFLKQDLPRKGIRPNSTVADAVLIMVAVSVVPIS